LPERFGSAGKQDLAPSAPIILWDSPEFPPFSVSRRIPKISVGLFLLLYFGKGQVSREN